jgi:hypothetical protein
MSKVSLNICPYQINSWEKTNRNPVAKCKRLRFVFRCRGPDKCETFQDLKMNKR